MKGFFGQLVAAVAATSVAVACSSPPSSAPQGALEVVLESDMALPKDIDHVRLSVIQDGRSVLSVDSDVRWI